jgi:hypothetical protein
MGKESTGGRDIPSGLFQFMDDNATEECFSAGNYLLKDADSGQQDQNVREKILLDVTIPGSVIPNDPYCECRTFIKI